MLEDRSGRAADNRRTAGDGKRGLQAIGGQGLVVLDPFAGSCTTVKVAAEMGHEAIGVELKGEYLARAREAYGW